MNVTLLGAGAWGTALAVQAASRHAVVLWARDAAHAGAMATAHENARYLPGVALPPALAISDSSASGSPPRQLVTVPPAASTTGTIAATSQ